MARKSWDKDIVVIRGGLVGTEVALFLAQCDKKLKRKAQMSQTGLLSSHCLISELFNSSLGFKPVDENSPPPDMKAKGGMGSLFPFEFRLSFFCKGGNALLKVLGKNDSSGQCRFQPQTLFQPQAHPSYHGLFCGSHG